MRVSRRGWVALVTLLPAVASAEPVGGQPWVVPLPPGAEKLDDMGAVVTYRVAKPLTEVVGFYRKAFLELADADCVAATKGGLQCSRTVVLDVSVRRLPSGEERVTRWSGDQVTVVVSA